MSTQNTTPNVSPDTDALPPPGFVSLDSPEAVRAPFRGRHFSDAKIEDGVISGARRGTSGAGEESDRLALGNAAPGIYAYRDDSIAHPVVATRKFEHRISGNFALANIDDNPLWGKILSAYDDPHMGTNEAEKALRDAGFNGYYSGHHPGTVFLFGDQQIERPQANAQSPAPPVLP